MLTAPLETNGGPVDVIPSIGETVDFSVEAKSSIASVLVPFSIDSEIN